MSNHTTRQSILRILTLSASSLALLGGQMTILPKPAEARKLVASTSGAPRTTQKPKAQRFGAEGSGTLTAVVPGTTTKIACPLKSTKVSADISGYVARVTVKQTFTNPQKDKKLEAVYTFPLSENSAVDEMNMKIGNRTINGTIKKREEARAIYDAAREAGHTASLLDQERTNIFTQSVANIEPGQDIEITIKYIETLPFEGGKYSFAFPTVVGPRFIPGEAVSGGDTGRGFAPNTNQVPDASRITPMPTLHGERAGHNISIDIRLDAGMPLTDLRSALHEVTSTGSGGKWEVALKDKETIPNKDFVLSWQVAQDTLKSGYLTYKKAGEKEGYFTVMLVPPKKVTPDIVAPKEMIFVIDCSGSQQGAPLDKCKETMRYILEHMNANDTFQIMTFNSGVETFAQTPQRVSPEMKTRALAFINAIQARGGTWMGPAVEKVCAMPNDAHRLRIVTFMTDGYVGNDLEVMGMVKKYRGASRWFPFGTGNSVNRTLIDGIAKEGGGESEFVLLNSSAEEAGRKFYDRIKSPVLTDVKLSYQGLDLKEVYPREVNDVWAERPLYFKGKYSTARSGTITLTGFAQGKPYKESLKVDLPDNNPANPGIASLWARAKVDRLMSEDWFGAQQGNVNKEIKDEIVETALKHHIMTQYTSFVAVDSSRKASGDKGGRVDVPIEMPDGVSEEGVFGLEMSRRARPSAAPMSSMGYAKNKTAFYRASAGGAGGASVNFAASPSRQMLQAEPLEYKSSSDDARSVPGSVRGILGGKDIAKKEGIPKVADKLDQDRLSEGTTPSNKFSIRLTQAIKGGKPVKVELKLARTLKQSDILKLESHGAKIIEQPADKKGGKPRVIIEIAPERLKNLALLDWILELDLAN